MDLLIAKPSGLLSVFILLNLSEAFETMLLTVSWFLKFSTSSVSITPVSCSPPAFLNISLRSYSVAYSSSLPTSHTQVLLRVSSSGLIPSLLRWIYSVPLPWCPNLNQTFFLRFRTALAIGIVLKPCLKRALICGTFWLSQVDALSLFWTSIGFCSQLLANSSPQTLVAICVLVLFLLVDYKFL